MARPPPAKLSCEAFGRYARTDPFALERVLRSFDVEPSLITYAAEAVALVAVPTQSLLAALVALLHHPKAYVREGACYGARPHLDQLRDVLQRVARDDENATIREIAQDILEDR